MGAPSKLRRQGREAFYPHGAPELNCPYGINSFSRSHWLDGWEEARLAHEKAEPARQAAQEREDNVRHALRALSYAIGHEGAENVKDLIEAMLEARQ